MRLSFRSYLYSSAALTLVGLALIWLGSRPLSPEVVAERISTRLESKLIALGKARIDFERSLDVRNPNAESTDDDFSFYAVENGRVVRWTDHHFVPNAAVVLDSFNIKLLKEGSGDYLVRKWNLGKERFIVGLIPLARRYNIVNNYLRPEWNTEIFPARNVLIHEPISTQGVAVCVQGDCPFRVSFSGGLTSTNEPVYIAAVICIFLALVSLIIVIYEWCRRVLVIDLVFVVLLVLLFVVRLIMTSIDFPSKFVSGDLFNPLIFASSSLNASLGDLLINEIALLILCGFLFRNFFRFRSVHYLQKKKTTSWLLSVVSAFLVLTAMLFPFVVVQTLYNNSQIDLSISESLRFDSLRITATVVVFISGICSFLFAHCFLRLLIGDQNRKRMITALLIGIFLFLLVNVLTRQVFFSSLAVGALYMLAVYFLRLWSSLRRLGFTTFTYFFLGIFCISLNSAYAMHYFSQQEKIASQFRFARNFLVDRDYFAEYLLQELSGRIAADAFIQSRVATPFLGKDAVKQKIRQVFLPGYFNKYDVEIFTFNASGEASDNHSGITLSGILDQYDKEHFRTEYEGVFFVNSPGADITQKYLVTVPVTWMQNLSGHVVIEFSLKKVIPENVYPELLVDNRFLKFHRAEELSYAVFSGNQLSYSSGSFNYEGLFEKSWFGMPELHNAGLTREGYDHIAEEDELGRVAVVSSRATPVAYSFANFSFLIVIGLASILLFVFIHGVVNFSRGGKLYFSARIQLFLNLAFFIPLILVSAMSLRVTNRSSQNQLNEEYLSKTRRFSEAVSEELYRYLTTSGDAEGGFQNTLADLSSLTNLDANIYDGQGVLLASSQPLIFENKLFSEFINPLAILKIRNGNNLFIETETAGTLEYYTVYSSLREPLSGQLIGVVAIPFFQSVYSAERVQISILSNILNIFSLIFIVLVVLSYFVTQWLTFPLTFITQSLRKTSLTKTNQPLVWKTDDEIGLMVKEYNQMLFSLSESKAELEQTQRERAWREIAQQVAHEIKNPLTPMKLTLQQLERLLQKGSVPDEKVQKAVGSLLNEVNTLNDIASSFSSFAKMPEPVMKPLELVTLLRRIINLHSHSGELKFESGIKEVWVKGDEQLLGRTFSNIILNALQATHPGERAKVSVAVESSGTSVRIRFRDNGKGISKDVAERIFIPHFTTKKSGSGLGLAIAKQAIEQMRGKLWFETSNGKGTTFFIELPLQDVAEGSQA